MHPQDKKDNFQGTSILKNYPEPEPQFGFAAPRKEICSAPQHCKVHK
jgi:hypothetical protein